MHWALKQNVLLIMGHLEDVKVKMVCTFGADLGGKVK